VVNLAHGKAVRAIRANSADAQIGTVLNMWPIHSATDAPADLAAARRVDGRHNRWFADPVLKGSYPADILELLGDAAPAIHPGDMETIHAPLDFLGINYYMREVTRDSSEAADFTHSASGAPHDAEFTDMGWEIYPDGLHELLVRVWKDYRPRAIYVTENGCAMPDQFDMRDEQGYIADPRRVDYLRRHFEAAARAIHDGVPLEGYFVWSFMDNFEWAEGYAKRFGLVYIDYPTQARVPKSSYAYYQRVIDTHQP
jgi:beta-glucosidase